MESFLLLSVHFLFVSFALILQELLKQLRKTNEPGATKELKDRLSWIVRTCPFDFSCIFGHLLNYDVYSLILLLSLQRCWCSVSTNSNFVTRFCRTNSWSTSQWSILNVQFWLSTRKKRGKQQNKENNHFILRNVSLSLSPSVCVCGPICLSF